MSHGIELPIDRVYSVEGTEWHGLATQVESITDTELQTLCPRLVEGNATVTLDGITVPLNHHKVIIADYRECRPDLGEEDQIVPLHVPRNSYAPISNADVIASLKKALADVDCKITTAGTLEGGKKFFTSVDIGSGEFEIKLGKGKKDKMLSFLNFITSHDGTLAAMAYDTLIRIVCMNTLRWSLQAAGDVNFRVYHTQNASLGMSNMGDLLNAVLKGRVEFKNLAEYFATVKIEQEEVSSLVAGYFCMDAQGNYVPKLSTRSVNSTNDIVTLFSKGAGNAGKTLWDALNGFTEYYTSGDGVGKKSDIATKAYKANFASGADHKSRFVNLIQVEETRLAMVEAGREALAKYAEDQKAQG
jgi:hypothetical protein